jgi:hypothetical protein
MSGKIEIVREGEIDFAKPLPRALLRDSRLSFGARGLFAFLWDLPNGWSPCLEHLVKMTPEGRDAIRARLGELQRVGAIRIEAKREDEDGNTLPRGQISGRRWVLASPARWAIEAPLSVKGKIQLSENPIVGESPSKVLQGSKALQEEAAAPRAHARGTDSAAASKGSNAKRQHPDRSRLGIECWYPSEDQEADAIVAAHDSDAITAAVATIRQQLNGAGKRTSPVPALVLAELERQQRERDAAVRRAQEDAELRVRAISEIDPAAQAKGQQLLPATLRARLPKIAATKEAAA